MTIRRLSADTIGQIAAGEVIERPAAAVKELLENAIDAGATRIDVALLDGGVELLEVRDNGGGITFDDLPLAVERHATSKIGKLDDLDGLRTLGFRGEALASLAAVAELRIQSRARDAPAGGELVVRYGASAAPRSVAWGDGTAISARRLFENVPARRKFLRQPGTEAGYVARVVGAYALAYPAIAFSLEIDGRRTLSSDGRGDPLSAAAAVWGADTAEQLAELETPETAPEGFVVGGVVSLPTLDRATRQQQFFFAQGRLVTSRQVATAFEQAYHTLLMVGRHPLGCIRLHVPPGRVDVNVHPTKSEVRFADERLMFSLTQQAVRATLRERTPSQTIPTIMSAPLADAQVQRRMALAHPSFATASQATAGVEREFDLPLPTPQQRARGRILPVLRVLGQIASMFIIAEGPEGMYLIDQHAAHERILFEQLMAQRAAATPDRQLLLEPVVVELLPRQHEVWSASRDDLDGFGFATEEFGALTIAVRSTPARLNVKDPARALLTVLEEVATGGRGDSRLESLAISAACHTSIRAGQALSLLEMRELVSQLERCSSPQACGHGRPTMLRMTAEELERQFSRR
jgi:DNA mismatch repair protein MutL